MRSYFCYMNQYCSGHGVKLLQTVFDKKVQDFFDRIHIERWWAVLYQIKYLRSSAVNKNSRRNI